jgi:sugar phosphate permease
MSFAVIGFISIALALMVLFLMKDFKAEEIQGEIHHKPRGADPLKASFFKPLGSPQFWIIGMTFFGAYGIVMTFQGLWATPYLMAVLKIDRIVASNLNMIIPIGFIIGAPLFGWFTDRLYKSKVRVIKFLLGILTITWSGIVFDVDLQVIGMSIILFFMGVTMGGITSLLWAHVRDITSPATIGTFSGLINPAPFLGVAVFQVLTGSLLDRASLVSGAYPAEAYESSFILCFVTSCACLLLSFCLKEER